MAPGSIRQNLPRIDVNRDSGELASATPPPATPEPRPDAAVETFLRAEVAGDATASFSVLADADRARYATAAGWAAAHRLLPRIMSFSDVVAHDGGDRVTASIGLAPTLDEVVGLVPARAEATYRVMHVANGWLVDLASSDLAPQYSTDDQRAAAAVDAWVSARQACPASAPLNEYRGGLPGSPSLADRLCHDTTDAHAVAIGAPRRLAGESGAQAIEAAFGADAASWARVVDVTTNAVSLRAVVAPVGDDWIVAGVLPSAPARGR